MYLDQFIFEGNNFLVEETLCIYKDGALCNNEIYI